jgi:hypothetical protein
MSPRRTTKSCEVTRGTPSTSFSVWHGRIGLPLSQRGIRIEGIEQSSAMVEQLRAKPGGDAIGVTIGDMSTSTVPTTFPLVYLVFNTIFNLLSQDAQVRCFTNAARHLTDDGCFVVEAGVPSAWIRGTQFVNVERVANDEVVLDVNRYDPVTQILDESHVSLTNAGVRLGPISCRLAWPSELDLMARIAGLRLVDRWAGWHHEPFTATSVRHVSVYARREADGAPLP